MSSESLRSQIDSLKTAFGTLTDVVLEEIGASAGASTAQVSCDPSASRCGRSSLVVRRCVARPSGATTQEIDALNAASDRAVAAHEETLRQVRIEEQRELCGRGPRIGVTVRCRMRGLVGTVRVASDVKSWPLATRRGLVSPTLA